MKTVTGHVIPSRAFTHVNSNVHIFNDSEHASYVEVADQGDIHIVKPLPYGRLIIGFTEPDGE